MKSTVHLPDDKPKIASAQDALNTHGYNGGRMPRPKTCHVTHTMVHDGMLSATKNDGFSFGGDASSRNDADPAQPMGGAPAGKKLTPVVAAFGMRSRTSEHDPELGKLVLDTATRDPHHPGFSKS